MSCFLWYNRGVMAQNNPAKERSASRRGVIYLITFPNGKVYVGQAIHLQTRKNRHRHQTADLKNKSVFACAVRKFGFDKLRWRILEKPLLSNLDERERFYITAYNSLFGDGLFSNGYNTEFGSRRPYKRAKFRLGGKAGHWYKCIQCGKEYIRRNDNERKKCRECANKGRTKYSLHIGRYAAIKNNCANCGKEYIRRASREVGLYCSLKCANAKRRNRQIRQCAQCGKNYESAAGKKGDFCSRKCYADSMRLPPETRACLYCGKDFSLMPGKRGKRFCSVKCSNTYRNKRMG